MKKCCENCKWWEPHLDGGYNPETHIGIGDCARFPPVPVYIPRFHNDDYPISVNPETGVLHVCGEFKALKNPRRL
jgi:hypothetical protein